MTRLQRHSIVKLRHHSSRRLQRHDSLAFQHHNAVTSWHLKSVPSRRYSIGTLRNQSSTDLWHCGAGTPRCRNILPLHYCNATTAKRC